MPTTHCHRSGLPGAHSGTEKAVGRLARSQPLARRRLDRYRHFTLATLLVLTLATVAVNAFAQLRDAPWGHAQYNANEFEVRRDALPSRCRAR